jgi:hypothetical protein
MRRRAYSEIRVAINLWLSSKENRPGQLPEPAFLLTQPFRGRVPAPVVAAEAEAAEPDRRP